MQNSVASGSVPSRQELRRFGKYHLIASLGQGGMAKVYLALMGGPSGFNKLLVVKVMRQDLLAGAEDSVRMFWAEARLAARLVHPNIVHTYEVGEHEGSYFLAMEYLDGQPLSAVLNRARSDGEIPVEEYLRVVSEIARGLHYAHQLESYQGEALHVVHRDVSPQNVIITYDGQVKLLDFGIAKSADAEQATQLGIVKGKLDYIAPEQLRGDAIDARADIFALGAILWEVIAGHRFAGGRKVSDVLKVQARIAGNERKLRSVKPDVPRALEQIVERATALDPGDRFQDAASFADALDEYLDAVHKRPGARSLARYLKPLFANERLEMHKLIDAQVQRLKQDPSGLSERASEPPLVTPPTRPSGFGLYVSDAHQDDRSSIRSMAAASMARPSAVAPSTSRERVMAITASALTVVAAATFAWFWAEPKQLPPPAEAPLSVAPLAPPLGAAAPAEQPGTPLPDARAPQSTAPSGRDDVATVSVRLLAKPAHARVTVDGVKVALPFAGTFRRDGALHHIEAAADGYRTAKQFVAFDRDQSIEITLERGHGTRSSGTVFKRLIERAEHSIAATPEPSAAAAPADPVAAPEEKAAMPDPSLPVLERPNPYESD
jgi:eukaryotic-like serine/threonine-protein kinase